MSNQKNPALKILEFFKLVGRLKHLKRTGWVLRHVKNSESIAGHMYRMSIMAFLLDKEASSDLNQVRCIKMALVHDISECIVGDLTPFCGVSIEEKHTREMEAMKMLCSLVEDDVSKELLELYQEYTEQSTTVAKCVKDLDKLDMLLQAFEYELQSEEPLDLQDFFDNTKGIQNGTVSRWFQELLHHRNKKCEKLSTLNKTQSSVFEFLLLIGKLKHLKRSCWNQQNSLECETVADHMYRTSIMALCLDDNNSLGLQKDKCVKMALIKNITESNKKNSGSLSMEEIFFAIESMQKVCGLINTPANKEILNLYEEYASQLSLEAKTVKGLEAFEYLLQEYEYNKMCPNFTKNLASSMICHDFFHPAVSNWAKELKELQKQDESLCSK